MDTSGDLLPGSDIEVPPIIQEIEQDQVVMDDGEDIVEAADGSDEAAETDDLPQILLRDPNERPVFKLSVKLLDTYKHINKVSTMLVVLVQKLQET